MTNYARILVGLLSLALLGCGLGDYEERAEKQRLRLKQYDEENAYLGQPLDPPWTKDEKSSAPIWPFDVYLRLPPGVSKEGETPPYKFNQLELFKFPGQKGYMVLATAAYLGAADKEGKFKPGEFTTEQFRARVRGALALHHPPLQALTRDEKKAPIKPHPVAGKETYDLGFDLAEHSDHPSAKDAMHSMVYFLVQDNRQVALVYQVGLNYKDDPTVRKTVEMSLKSLMLGKAAAAQREEFYKMHKKS